MGKIRRSPTADRPRIVKRVTAARQRDPRDRPETERPRSLGAVRETL